MATVYFLAATGRESVPVMKRMPVRVMARRFAISSPALAVPVIVLVGMGFGIITPTEVGIVCIVYALLLGLAYREASPGTVWASLVESSRSTITIMFIIAVSTVAGWIYTYDGVAQSLASAMLALTDNKLVILLIINVILLFLGCILEPIPVLILTTPIFLPVVKELGIDPVHFGIMINLNITIGMITPPMGVGLYVMMGIIDIKFEHLVRACLPFMVPLIGCLLLFTFVPELSLWLPDLVMGPQR